MIPLHRPWIGDEEKAAVLRTLESGRLAGNGPECAALERELQDRLGARDVLAVSSATHALELSMWLLGIEGGEVIVPSFTFPSVANAVLRAGGTIQFCEVREADLNVDLDHARSLIGPSTRALVITHYAGHPQDAGDIGLPIVEDAAHALGSRIREQWCGTMGEFGCFSFHATKNVVAGEGGALVLRTSDAARRARIYREKGTNRDDFSAGRVSHYAWVGFGSSIVMPELSAALARAQLRKLDRILAERRMVAGLYDQGLADLEREGRLHIVRPAPGTTSSHHIYAILVDPPERRRIAAHMKARGVEVSSHFMPLHSSPFGRTISNGPPLATTDRVAASILRLPIYPGLSEHEVEQVVEGLQEAHRG
jgi:dTDP-4-amino-4,6-dideoxygalactose transaminase